MRRPPPKPPLNRRADSGLGGQRRPSRRGLSTSPKPEGPPRPEPAWQPEQWVPEPSVDDDIVVREAAEGAVARGSAGNVKARPPTVEASASPSGSGSRAGRRRAATLPPAVLDELQGTAGPRRADKMADRLGSARRAFQRERYQEARAVLAPLAREVPDAPAVRELLGLTLYRLERWRSAATELEAYKALTGSVDQLPVLADCYRAQRRYGRVAELWAELRDASPSAAIVAEGRIVAAGASADQGDLKGAIALLEKVPANPRVVREHHLRQWYALADLYDRAGDTPRARALFRRIREVDPGFADVSQRIAHLR